MSLSMSGLSLDSSLSPTAASSITSNSILVDVGGRMHEVALQWKSNLAYPECLTMNELKSAIALQTDLAIESLRILYDGADTSGWVDDTMIQPDHIPHLRITGAMDAAQMVAMQQLQLLLPHISTPIIDKLCVEVNDALGIVERPSIREVFDASVAQAAGQLKTQVTLMTGSTSTPTLGTSIKYAGEELFLYRMLPNNDGVELRSQFRLEYRRATPAYVAEVKAANVKRITDIAQCKKQLQELPIALVKSREEMITHSQLGPDKVDLKLLGRMVMDQKHLTEEIEEQTRLLPQLEKVAIRRLDPSGFQHHVSQSMMRLKFGWNRLNSDELVNVMPIGGEQIKAAPTAALTQIDPRKQ